MKRLPCQSRCVRPAGARSNRPGRGFSLVGALTLPDSRHRSRGSEQGFVIVELLIASIILAVALIGIAGALLGSSNLHASNSNVGLATLAAATVVEEVRGMTIADVYALHNSDKSDDPGGAGTAPGPRFEVEGLPPLADGGGAGQILFPVAGSDLSEIPGGVFDGETWDLNLDTVIVKGARIISEVKILPIVVRVSWSGASGERSVEVRTVISDRD